MMMRVKFIFRNNNKALIEKWDELDIIPHIDDTIYFKEILNPEDSLILNDQINTSDVEYINLRKDKMGFYYEIEAICEEN